MATHDVIVVARHFETEKNLKDVHGTSELAALTDAGVAQAKRMAHRLRAYSKIDRIVATPTPQAVSSAQILSEQAGLPFTQLLTLAPVNLGVADGLSTEALRAHHRGAFTSLDRFRARVVDVRELEIPNAESAVDVEQRLTSWWVEEGATSCSGAVVIGSNSTVLMLTHLLEGNLPSTGRYRFLATPNGSMRVWRPNPHGTWSSTQPLPETSWPEIELAALRTDNGSVAYSRFLPGWDERKHGVLVVPGYFGSSRHGPYGLYTRLARAWSYEGFETMTIDLPGSGDSSPVDRTFETEVDSVVAAAEFLLQHHEDVIIVGHSMGAATALEARHRLASAARASVWGLAPLCSLEDLRRAFLSPQNLDELASTGITQRHGLELRAEMIEAAGAAWNAFAGEIELVWLADTDVYTAGQELSAIAESRRRIIDGADHNFSLEGNFSKLLRSTHEELVWREVSSDTK